MTAQGRADCCACGFKSLHADAPLCDHASNSPQSLDLLQAAQISERVKMRHTLEQLLKVSRLHHRQELAASQALCTGWPKRWKQVSPCVMLQGQEGLKYFQMRMESTRSIANQSVTAFGNAVSKTTVHRNLIRLGLKQGAPKMLPPLSEKQKNARIKFAQHHIASKTDFKRVMSAVFQGI